MLSLMRLGTMLGSSQDALYKVAEANEKAIAKEQKRAREASRSRNIERSRRLGNTIRYNRDDR